MIKLFPFFFSQSKKLKVNKKIDNCKGVLISAINGYNIPGRPDSFPRDIYKTEKYNQNIIKVINKLNDKIDNISIKYFNYDREPNLKNEILKKNYKKNVNIIENRSLNVLRLSVNYRIILETINSTGFIEAMFNNTPVLLLLDKDYSSTNMESDEIYKKLTEVKVVFYSANKLSDHLNYIYDNIADWWNSTKVQQMRIEFCDNFAKSNDNNFKNFKQMLYFDNLKEN